MHQSSNTPSSSRNQEPLCPTKRIRTAPAKIQEWLQAFAVTNGDLSIACFTQDGSVTHERRSFQLCSKKGDKQYSVRLKHKELIWIEHMLELDFGTHTLVLFPGRELSLSISDALIVITAREDTKEFKLFIQPNQINGLTAMLTDMIGILETDWASLRRDKLYEALGLAETRTPPGNFPIEAKALFSRALGDRTKDPRIDTHIDYGRRLGEYGNPEISRLELADKVAELLPLLEPHEVVDLHD